MPPKTKFIEGDRVLCFHGPLLYEAKCVKFDAKEKLVRYYIHYNGWNKNWDEWVPENRILKFNETGLQKQRELLKAHQATKKTKPTKKQERDKDKDKDKEKKEERASTPSIEKPKPKGREPRETKESREIKEVAKVEVKTESAPSTPIVLTDPGSSSASSTPASSADQLKRKRARLDPGVESEEAFLSKIEVKVKIPEELKPWLVDDWDLVTRQKQLVMLPCRNTVDNIFDEYIKAKTAKGNNPNKDIILEVTQGLRDYFNVMLGTQLLYKFERPQYADMLTEKRDTPMTSLYGAMHLLRLFVKLGGMLAYTTLEEKGTQLLLTHIHDFLRYMQRNASSLFSLSDYFVASPEYHRKAM